VQYRDYISPLEEKVYSLEEALAQSRLKVRQMVSPAQDALCEAEMTRVFASAFLFTSWTDRTRAYICSGWIQELILDWFPLDEDAVQGLCDGLCAKTCAVKVCCATRIKASQFSILFSFSAGIVIDWMYH
jgi:hypothetical protein